MTTVDICGVPTSIAISAFDDYIKILVSQTGKFGSWYKVTSTSGIAHLDEDSDEIFSVDVLLGDRNDFYSCGLARTLGEVAHKARGTSLPLVVSLALLNPKVPPTREFVQALVTTISQIISKNN